MTSPVGVGATGADQDGAANEETSYRSPPQPLGQLGELTAVDGTKLAAILQEELQSHNDQPTEISSFATNYETFRTNRMHKDSEPSASAASEGDHIQTPIGSDRSSSIPDDTPSVQGSARSTPSGSVLRSGRSARLGASPSPRPFEWRFQARSSSGSPIPRVSSPAFLTSHSRQPSISSQISVDSLDSEKGEGEEEDEKPWEAIRWTKLKKISNQAFSEVSKRTFGTPTFLVISASIVIGTKRGLFLVFDYQQNLKQIIGQGTLATEAGSISSLAVSADHSTIAAGHSNGSIFTWELAHPAKPFLHIPPINNRELQERTSDGHVSGNAVLHVGFLGQRRTALVSADESGMAFSHLATRGLGAAGRTVKTTRILGRYPNDSQVLSAIRKPTSVLALSSLPLGNVEKSTDSLGLTAILTPFLLVIVSTTPVAQTQFKLPRERGVTAHGPMTGTLAWFPSVKTKAQSSNGQSNISCTKLAYCWSNVLSILEIEEESENLPIDPEKKPCLGFKTRSQWTSDEAILTVQWLSRSILAVLTITQRLLILEDHSFRLADSSDLISKHIYHQDLFSHQLQSLVDKFDQEDASMHGVIPDAYYMSFRTYKSRLFLLGVSELSMGILSNWIDRLSSLTTACKYVPAIELGTAYYAGETDKLTIGLPDDNIARKTLVQVKLVDIILASLRHVSGADDDGEPERDLRKDLVDLVPAIFKACMNMNNLELLFDQTYETYSEFSMQDIFLYQLESYILDGAITTVPTLVLQDMLNWFSSHGLGERLEAMIIRLNTDTMDIDHVTSVCKKLLLYDSLVYVWTRGLSDYVTPLIELISAIMNRSEEAQSESANVEAEAGPTLKLFSYMAYTLTGRQYPGDADLPFEEAVKARSSVYGFTFSHRIVRWPKPRGKLITTRSKQTDAATYPYLRTLLRFDAFNFLSMLNEAFEDTFLNGAENQITNGILASGGSEDLFGASINRQRIVNVLLEVVTQPEFSHTDRLYLDIFIARNLPKFSQFILLPGSIFRQILIELCKQPPEELANECQLSVEYLLSIYHPSSMQDLVPYLIEAKFFRVLKTIYRTNKQYSKWLETFFDDSEDRKGVFSCISDCLRSGVELSPRQVRDVKSVIVSHAKEMGEIDASQTTATLCTFAPDLLDQVYNHLDEGSRIQYLFLQSLMEPKADEKNASDEVQKFVRHHQDHYVELMCQQEPRRVVGFISTVQSGDLHLDRILPTLEKTGVIDAAVMLLAYDGLARNAMDRLVEHLGTLKTAIVGILNAERDNSEVANAEEASNDLLEAINKYVKLGILLCQSGPQTASVTLSQMKSRIIQPTYATESQLTLEEALWLDLIDAAVNISRAFSFHTAPNITDHMNESPQARNAINGVRLIVQQTFTALLASTAPVSAEAASEGMPISARPKPTHQQQHEQDQPPRDPATSTAAPISHPVNTSLRPLTRAKKRQDYRFLNILRAFLRRTSLTTPTLSDLRRVFSSIFSAYAFEASMLTLANSFIDKDVWVHVENAERARRRGWRPRSQLCEWCRRKAWGPGYGEMVWNAWDTKREMESILFRQNWSGSESGVELSLESDTARAKGKARASESGKSVVGTGTFSNKEIGKGRVETGPADQIDENPGGGQHDFLRTQSHPPGSGDRGSKHEEHKNVGGATNTVKSPLDTSTLLSRPDSIVVFACHHIYHLKCLGIAMQAAGMPILEQEEQEDAELSSRRLVRFGSGHVRAGPKERFRCPICDSDRLTGGVERHERVAG